jgi:hypothetical protein
MFLFGDVARFLDGSVRLSRLLTSGIVKIPALGSSLSIVKAADWFSLAGVVAAAVSAFVAVVSAKRAAAAQSAAANHEARAEIQRRLATQAAEEAAVAQRQTAAEAGRVAKAIEERNRMAEEQAERAEGVPWRVEYREGDLFEVKNITNTTKFGVQISGPGVLRPVAVDRIDGHGSAEFYRHPASGGNNQVEVIWYRREDLSDEPRRWTGTRPPGV